MRAPPFSWQIFRSVSTVPSPVSASAHLISKNFPFGATRPVVGSCPAAATPVTDILVPGSVADPNPNPDPDPEVWIRIRIRIWILLSPSKKSKKNPDSYSFVTSFWLSIFETNVLSKSNKQKNFLKNLLFVGILGRSMTKIAGSGSSSGSTPKCHGSATLVPGRASRPWSPSCLLSVIVRDKPRRYRSQSVQGRTQPVSQALLAASSLVGGVRWAPPRPIIEKKTCISHCREKYSQNRKITPISAKIKHFFHLVKYLTRGKNNYNDLIKARLK